MSSEIDEMDLNDVFNEMNTLSDKIIENSMAVTAEQLGLDPRCYGPLFVMNDKSCVIAKGRSSRCALDYYGGFEYVSNDCIFVVGRLTIYTNLDNRVSDALDHLDPSDSEKE